MQVMRDTVHDNWLYAQVVDHEKCRIVLHTVWPHQKPPEYLDIIFEGVVLHHFEQQKVGSGPEPAHVLFDVEEADPLYVLGQYPDLLARTKQWGWPMLHYDRLDDLVAKLMAGGAKCYEVYAVCGVHGFVFATSMTLRPRQSRANVADGD
jgi:hypothetical protein